MPFSDKKSRARFGLVLLAFVAFISLGLPDGLLGVAWPSIRRNFSLPLDALGVLMLAGMAGYLGSSFASGRLITRLGVGGLLAASCAATGAGLIGYTLAPSWATMVGLGVVAGLGAGAIDAGINTFIAANYREGLMQWLHASFGVGVTLGPMIMTAGLSLYHSWRPGYSLVGAAQLTLAACFALTIPLWRRAATERRSATTCAATENKRLTDYQTSFRETLRQPAVWFNILLFFLYTGSEVTLGSWAYTLLTESRGIDPQAAGLWAGSYWAMFTIGRVLAGLYTKHIGVHRLVRASLLAALAGAVLLWWNPSDALSLAGVAITGFAIAPIFPGLVSGTSERVGPRFAANTIGMQIGAAGLGGALVPGLAGVLARRATLEIIPAYLSILFILLLALHTLTLRQREL